MRKDEFPLVDKLREEAYQQGRADAIEECIETLKNSIPYTDQEDIIYGFSCAIERLEQLKEQK